MFIYMQVLYICKLEVTRKQCIGLMQQSNGGFLSERGCNNLALFTVLVREMRVVFIYQTYTNANHPIYRYWVWVPLGSESAVCR